MKPDYQKNLFDFMKGNGFFSEYTDYQDYRKRKLEIPEPDEKEKAFENWKESLKQEERQQFLKVFGD